jgi:hypothetical protein
LSSLLLRAEVTSHGKQSALCSYLHGIILTFVEDFDANVQVTWEGTHALAGTIATIAAIRHASSARRLCHPHPTEVVGDGATPPLPVYFVMRTTVPPTGPVSVRVLTDAALIPGGGTLSCTGWLEIAIDNGASRVESAVRDAPCAVRASDVTVLSARHHCPLTHLWHTEAAQSLVRLSRGL